jgi:hypothetical protein
MGFFFALLFSIDKIRRKVRRSFALGLLNICAKNDSFIAEKSVKPKFVILRIRATFL